MPDLGKDNHELQVACTQAEDRVDGSSNADPTASLVQWLEGALQEHPDVQREKPRPKAMWWVVGVDHMLRVAGLSGFAWFRPEPTMNTIPPTLPTLSLHMDQGSDGWSAGMYLTNAVHLNLLLIPDTSHRCWNDCRQALKDAKLWGLVLLTTLV